MAYISQETKSALSPKIKAVCKKYGVKCSISINHHSSLVVTISEGVIDFPSIFNNHKKKQDERYGRVSSDYNEASWWQIRETYLSYYPGVVENFFEELFSAMKTSDWADRSDIQSDYFNISYYVDVNVGKWNKPYRFIESF